MTSRLVTQFRRRQRLGTRPTEFLLELTDACEWRGFGVTRHTPARTWFLDGKVERSVDRAELDVNGYAWSRGRMLFGRMLFTEHGAQRFFGTGWRDPGRVVRRPATDALAVLGLEPESAPTSAEIRRAFRLRAKKIHPDVAGGDGSEFIRLHAAYTAAPERTS